MMLNNIDAKSLLQANATIIAGIFILVAILGNVYNQIPDYYQETYLFTWDHVISGNATDIPPRLKERLLNNHGITWINHANISKNDTAIMISYDNHTISIIKSGNIILNIDNKKVEELLINLENNRVYYKDSTKFYSFLLYNTVIRYLPIIAFSIIIPFGISVYYILYNNFKNSKILFFVGITGVISVGITMSLTLTLLIDPFKFAFNILISGLFIVIFSIVYLSIIAFLKWIVPRRTRKKPS